MKKIIFLIFFSFLFAQKIDFHRMSAKEIANLMYKYMVNKLPMRLNKFVIIDSMIVLENKMTFLGGVDLIELMHFYSKEYSEIISVLKRNNKNFDEIEFLKKSLTRKDLNNFLNEVKRFHMQSVCFRNKSNYGLIIFFKKGGILEYRIIDNKLGLFIGSYTITKKDCKKINPNF